MTLTNLLTARAKRKHALRVQEARHARNRTLRGIARKGTPKAVFAAIIAANTAYATAIATAGVEMAAAITAAPNKVLQHWL